MKKNTSWKFTDESSVTFQSFVSGPGEFGLKNSFIDYLIYRKFFASDLKTKKLHSMSRNGLRNLLLYFQFLLSSMFRSSGK